MVQQFGLSHNKADLANVTAERLICRFTIESLTWRHSPREPASRLLVVDYTEPPVSWRGQRFIFTGIVTYSAYEFAFSSIMLLPAPPSGFTEYFIHCHGILCCIASDQSIHSTAT